MKTVRFDGWPGKTMKSATIVVMTALVLTAFSAVAVAADNGLTESEIERKKAVEEADITNLRAREDFIVSRSEKFLKMPDRPVTGEYAVAETVPTVKLRILPDLDPEFFSTDDAYQAGWANWAKITRSEDNRFYMAASDHRARGSQINLYEYRPDDGVVERVLDVTRTLGWHEDMYTDGKIHGRMGIMPDGTMWLSTHRGPTPTAEWWEEGYRGSWLLSYNIHTGEAKNRGIPLLGCSLPVHTLDPQRGIFMATGGLTPEKILGLHVPPPRLTSLVLSWDVHEKRVRFAGYPPDGWVWQDRSVFLDKKTGHFWGMDFSERDADPPGKHRFMSFDPARNRFKRHDVKIPENPFTGQQSILRGHTKHPDADGWYYWATLNGTFFRFRPDWDNGPEIEELGVTWDKGRDVLQMGICPALRYVYYQPRSHCYARNDAFPAPLIQYDIVTGQRKAIAFLRDYHAENYGFLLGAGIYGLEISKDGSFVVMVDNGAFGRRIGTYPALIVVEIPEEERSLD